MDRVRQYSRCTRTRSLSDLDPFRAARPKKAHEEGNYLRPFPDEIKIDPHDQTAHQIRNRTLVFAGVLPPPLQANIPAQCCICNSQRFRPMDWRDFVVRLYYRSNTLPKATSVGWISRRLLWSRRKREAH